MGRQGGKKPNSWERNNDFSQQIKIKKNHDLEDIGPVKAEVFIIIFKPLLDW